MAGLYSIISPDAVEPEAVGRAQLYYRDIEFASQLCSEFAAVESSNAELSANLSSARNALQLIIEYNTHLKSSSSHLFRGVRPPAWPRHEALLRFDLTLHRLTTQYHFFKKWIPRFFILRGSRLYYSNGKGGHPDSLEGSLAFMRSNPQLDGRCCINLTGCRAIPCSAAVDGQAFAFEIKFPASSQGARDLCLAAADDVTRQRCVHVINAASAGAASSLSDIASSAALTPDLFMMRSLVAVNAVLAALGRPAVAGLDVQSLTAAGVDLECCIAAGVDIQTIKTQGFTAHQVKAAGCDFISMKAAGFNLPSLKAAGFDITTFREATGKNSVSGCSWSDVKKAGFTAAEMVASGCDLLSLKAAGFTAAQVKTEGFDVVSAHSAGYHLLSLVAAFGYKAVAATGCDMSCILRDGSDLYATLNLHQVDNDKLIDESKFLKVFWVGDGEPPDGWEWVHKDDADAIRVCRAHPWQCDKLIFGPHEDEYGTAKHPSYECPIGSASRMACYSEGFVHMAIDASELQQFSACDFLLRLRRPQPHQTPSPSRA